MRNKSFKMGWTALVMLMSALALFATVVIETEPNNTTQTAQPVILGDTIQGIISSDTDRDFFKYNLTQGMYIFKMMYPNGNPGFQDWVVVTDANGNEFPHFCYDHNGVLSSYIKVCNDVVAYVKVSKNETSGLTNQPYRFSLTADSEDPAECNDATTTARAINSPGVVIGKIPIKNDADFLKINAQAGIFSVAINTPQHPGLAFSLNLYQGNNSTPIATTASGFDLTYTLPAAGVYYLGIEYAQDTMSEYPYNASLLYSPDTCTSPAIGVINVQKNGKMVLLQTLVQHADSLSINWGDGLVSDTLAHTYQNNGNYTIQITAFNGCGTASATTTALILTARFHLVPVENVVPGTPVKMALVCDEGEFQAATVQFTCLTDVNKVQFTGLQSGTLNVSNLVKNTDQNSPGYGRVAGNFNPNGSETISQGDTVFYILLSTNGALQGDSVPVDLNGPLNFVFGAFILGAAEEIQTELVPGSVEFVEDINFKVKVVTPTTVPVSGVEVTFTSPDTVITALTNANGLVDIILPYATKYTVTCKKDTFLLNGISPVDAFKINRTIVLLNNNGTTPYSYVAADFDCSENITTLDAVKILQYIVGLLSTPPCDQLVFVDAAYTFPAYLTNTATYFNFPTSVVAVNPNPDNGVQMSFVCVVRGDYDHNADPGFNSLETEDRGEDPEARFNYSLLEGENVVTAYIRPQEALSMAAGAFTLRYDNSMYQFQSAQLIQDQATTFMAHEAEPGQINMAFMNTAGRDMQIDAAIPLIELRFKPIRSTLAPLKLAIAEKGIAPEISDKDGNLKIVTLESSVANAVTTQPVFNYFPNPVVDQLTVSFPACGDAQLTLFDSNGRIVLEQNASSSWQTVVPVAQLANGTYTCRIVMKDQVSNRKILLVH